MAPPPVAGSPWVETLRGIVEDSKVLSDGTVSGLFSRDSFGWFGGRTGSNDDGVGTGAVVAGVAAGAVVALGVRSLCVMWGWRRALRSGDGGVAAGPSPLPLLGNVLELRNGYYETLYRFVDKPASVFWVLSTPFVVVNEEGALRRVLGGGGGVYMKPKYFGYRSKAVKEAVKAERDNVAAESKEYDAHGDASRVALQNMIEGSFGTIKSSMDRLMRTLADASERVDIEDDQEEAVTFVRKAIVALNLDVLFGLAQSSSAADAARVADMIGFAGSEFARRMVNPLRVLVDIPGNLRYVRDVGGLIGLGRKLCTVLDESVRSIGDTMSNGMEAASSSASSASWVHAWVGKVGKIGKLGKVLGLLMASTQTVPLTAVWMLHLVSKDPKILERLRRELHGLGIKSLLDLKYEHLDDMVLADAVIKETLRMYPPFPLIQREAQEDDVIGGVTVPKGTPVYVVPWLVHRNPKYWEDPHSFKPGRFSSKNASHGDAPSDWVYIPFGRGPRMCAGSKLAMAELKVLLTHAVLSFEWHTTSGQGAEKEDSPFPELGMIPKGIRLFVKRVQDELELENAM